MSAFSWNPALVWFLVGLALVLLEFAVPGVVLVFIGLGAWITALAVKLGLAGDAGVQMAWFGGSSLVLLLGLRRFCKGWFAGFSSKHDTRNNLEEFTGSEVLVLERIAGQTRGRVEFKGANWSARAADGADTVFENGERAVIAAVDGLCLLLKKR